MQVIGLNKKLKKEFDELALDELEPEPLELFASKDEINKEPAIQSDSADLQ